MSKVTLILLIFSLFITSCNNSNDHRSHDHKVVESYYTCSMHPQVKEKGPGKCPICHMNLTKVKIEKSDVKQVVKNNTVWQCKNFPDVVSTTKEVCPMDGTEMVIKKDDVSKIIAKVKLRRSQMTHFRPDYFQVTKMKMNKKVRLLGTVLQSEEKESNIPARIGGRVEKVYIKSTGSTIQIGDPVIDYYAPQLITAGEEYLLARKSYEKLKDVEFKDLFIGSKKRLLLWGIRKGQLETWYKNNKIPRKITIYSSSSGVVRKRNARVGKYFKEGQNFFELSNLSDVWVSMDVYEHDAALVKIGQKVNLEFIALPGRYQNSQIDFISPVIDESSRTLKIRATIKNDRGVLKPGMVAEGILNVDIAGMPLVIPRSAVIDTGKRKVVWLRQNENTYIAKSILVGHESEGYVEVIKGLGESDKVIIEGNFLLDAQAQLFGGYEDFNRENRDKNNTSLHQH